jgi:hypothetical protein
MLLLPAVIMALVQFMLLRSTSLQLHSIAMGAIFSIKATDMKVKSGPLLES